VQSPVPEEVFEQKMPGTELALSAVVPNRVSYREGAQMRGEPQKLLRKKIVRAKRADGTTFSTDRVNAPKKDKEE
jgi:hypothetical protein